MTYGKATLPLWPLDPSAIYLNHGTVGVVPRAVLAEQQRLRDEIERHPSRFMLRDLWTFTGSTPAGATLMRQAASAVAAFVGARADDLVFVDNTTAGANAVLRSFPFEEGDEIVVTDHAYGGLLAAVRYAAARFGLRVTTVTVPYPLFDAEVLLQRIGDAMTGRTRLVMIDHIAAESALVFPVARIVAACHARNVPVLVDGAHAPGAIPVDVSSVGADFYIANLHKWAMAPRSSAFLVTAPRYQSDIHPAVISWGYQSGYTQEFDWVGTRDPTPWLCAPDGIRFLESLDLREMQRYNHDLAWRAAQHLTDRWRTPLMFDECHVGTMASIMAPESCGSTKEHAVRLRDRLLFEHNIEVQVHARDAGIWIRVCGQIYNDDSDIEKLAAAVLSDS